MIIIAFFSSSSSSSSSKKYVSNICLIFVWNMQPSKGNNTDIDESDSRLLRFIWWCLFLFLFSCYSWFFCEPFSSVRWLYSYERGIRFFFSENAVKHTSWTKSFGFSFVMQADCSTLEMMGAYWNTSLRDGTKPLHKLTSFYSVFRALVRLTIVVVVAVVVEYLIQFHWKELYWFCRTLSKSDYAPKVGKQANEWKMVRIRKKRERKNFVTIRFLSTNTNDKMHKIHWNDVGKAIY